MPWKERSPNTTVSCSNCIKDSIADKERLIERIEAEIDEATKAYQVEVDLLQTIPGVGKDSAISIISEIGGRHEQVSERNPFEQLGGDEPGEQRDGWKKKVAGQYMGTNTCKAPWFNAHGGQPGRKTVF